jgi:hypothetical protein
VAVEQKPRSKQPERKLHPPPVPETGVFPLPGLGVSKAITGLFWMLGSNAGLVCQAEVVQIRSFERLVPYVMLLRIPPRVRRDCGAARGALKPG